MAEKLAQVKKKGGELKETTLWTNASPTSSMADATQLTLSDALSNYDYIKITVRKSTTDSSSASYIMSVEEFEQISNTRLALSYVASYPYIRTCRYTSDTKVQISASYRYSTSTSDNSKVIPTQICGLK